MYRGRPPVASGDRNITSVMWRGPRIYWPWGRALQTSVATSTSSPCCIKGLLAEMGCSLALVIRSTKIPTGAQRHGSLVHVVRCANTLVPQMKNSTHSASEVLKNGINWPSIQGNLTLHQWTKMAQTAKDAQTAQRSGSHLNWRSSEMEAELEKRRSRMSKGEAASCWR